MHKWLQDLSRRNLRRGKAGGKTRRFGRTFECLEERVLLHSYSVLNGNSSGPDSLRQAILDANDEPNTSDYDYIYISSSVTTITLASGLPEITEGVKIAPSHTVTINGTGCSSRGLAVNIADDATPWGRVWFENIKVYNTSATAFDFAGDGLHYVTLKNCISEGTAARPYGGGMFVAPSIIDGRTFTVDGCTFIKGFGIGDRGHVDSFTIQNSRIGTNVYGQSGLGNNSDGICFDDATGTVTISGNVISSNDGAGIKVLGPGATDLQVNISGNWIGTNTAGTTSLPNTEEGIFASLWYGNVAGDSAIQSSNVIKFNDGAGIRLTNCQNIAVTGNTIQSNDLDAIVIAGTDPDHEATGINVSLNNIIANGGDGIDISADADCYARVIQVEQNTLEDNVGYPITTSGDGVVQQCCFSENAYETPAAPISLGAGTNHSLTAPSIVESFFYQESGNWIIPVSFDPPAGFASADFLFELYTYDPATDTYAYYDDRTGTMPAEGPYTDSFTVPVLDVAEGEYLTIVAICTDAASADYIGDTSPFATPVMLQVAAAVQDRQVFYNDSWLDGNEPLANADDDDAIDDTKDAWIPGETLGSNHTTGYNKGINGVMVDIENLANPGGLSEDDFLFEYVVSGDWTTWSEGPSDVTVRSGAGINGSDRITLAWDWATGHHAVVNNWLKVTVLANADTGLQDPDVFCFGNLPGDANGDRFVGGDDLDIVRANWGLTGRLISQGDINLDNFVGADDLDLVRAYWGVSLAAPPSEGDGMMAGCGGELYTSSWSKEVDDVFFRYGFGDDDPTNDLVPGDELWDQFVDELFTTVEAALANEFAEAV